MLNQPLIWKQTSKIITQVPLSDVIDEVSTHDTWTPAKIKKNLMEEKKLLHIPGAYYHVWRDSLH